MQRVDADNEWVKNGLRMSGLRLRFPEKQYGSVLIGKNTNLTTSGHTKYYIRRWYPVWLVRTNN